MARTNTFQADYAWGRSTLVDYRNAKGERLQGALYYPAGYVPGKTYPMIVYVYERLSGCCAQLCRALRAVAVQRRGVLG